MSHKFDACPLCGATKDTRAKRCKACYAKTRPRKSLEARFWRGVDKRGPTECWPWKGTVHNGDYGQLGRGGRGNGMVLASHVSYELHCGPIPDGLEVCHTCDNPPCVNPAHLFLGTRQDNVDDRVRKGRNGRAFGDANGTHTHPEKVTRGSTHYAAKLTEEQVKAIRAVKPAKGVHEAAQVVATQYGTTKSYIIKIWYGYKWKHL